MILQHISRSKTENVKRKRLQKMFKKSCKQRRKSSCENGHWLNVKNKAKPR